MNPAQLPEQTCPHCQTPIGPRPFCPRDGAIAGEGRFVIGTRYVAEELLGGGATAFVFAGRHLVLGKPVAIKVLRDEPSGSLAAKRFLREARNASQLSHENIISVIDFGHDEQLDLAYLVMELFAGQSLDRIIRSSAPIPPSRALPMLVQLARALASSHGAGVLHRDVNPRNVLVGRGDLIKLCDFGLSRSLEGHERLTSTGSVLGTPAYMAPEQIRGDDEITSGADVFAFGCTACEMLTGKIPHDGATPVALLANRLSGPAPEAFDGALDVPGELRELLAACLAPEPAHRPAAMEIEHRLLAISAISGPGRKMAALDGTLIGRYKVVRLLGKGGVSSVYLAEHPVIGTRVAIKVIAPEIAAKPDLAERFVQEARATNELANPHLVRYFDFGILDTGQPYAVMEYLAGETLAARIAREGTLSLELTAEILRQVAGTMVQVHAAQLVHRDLKPENLYLTTTPDGRIDVKILDFGIAKALAPGASPTQTSVGMILGTPYYCAPEQALGLPVGPSSDVYALGATAYEMLSGKPPFLGDIAQVLAAKQAKDAPPLERADLPGHVARTIARMLARDPNARVATMTDVLAEVGRWTRPTTQTDLIAPEGALRRSKMPLMVAALLACVLVAAIAVFVFARSVRDDAPAPTPARSKPTVDPISDDRPQPPPAPVQPPAAPAAVETPPSPAAAIAPKSPPRPGAKPPAASSKRQPAKHTGHDDAVISDPFQEGP
jgi:serine/threonine-protein kinase